MSAVIPPAPTTEQIVAAFAAALLPLAGPFGIAASALVPALQQLLETFRNAGTKNYTVAELVAIVTSGSAHLTQLQADAAKADAKPAGP